MAHKLFIRTNIGWGYYCKNADGGVDFLGMTEDEAFANIQQRPDYVEGEPFDTIFAPVQRFEVNPEYSTEAPVDIAPDPQQ